MIDREPALIVQCSGVADVINSVNMAKGNNLLVSVRGGGHNVAGNAICDGGIMIDLSLMRSVRVDPSRRTPRVEGGATWRDFDHEAQAFGLATTGGFIPNTGVAGLTLGGGVGWLMGKYGLACDNLLSVDMVSADGQLLSASSTENTDLFWGIRGGGGNFGVVTSFEFQLHPVSEVLGGLVIYPIERARDVLKLFRYFTATSPDEVRCAGVLLTSPDGVLVSAIGVCYIGPISEGEKVLKPLREFGPPLADMVQPMPYTALQGMLEAGFPKGFQNYWKSNFMKELSDEAINTMAETFAGVPSPHSTLMLEQVGGAVSHISNDATAFSHRDMPYNMLVLGMWPDPADDSRNIQWVRDTWNALQPYSSGGVYVNYLGQEADEGAERVRAAYSPQKYDKLVALKQKYDPTNLFRMNQNIRPAG